MLKQTVLKQKQENERLLSLPYVEREKTAQARKWLDSDLIKVVLGPRRAGKSVFSLMLLKDRPFAYFNFDDESISSGSTFDYDGLLSELGAAYGGTKCILFDEIQNLPKWELFVNRLHRQGYNLILTGSNARLLSSELATALTGRHIPIEILPFSFGEFLRAKKFSISADLAVPEQKGELFRHLEHFLAHGGYPEVVVKDIDPIGYLNILFDSVLFKDVVKRHKVRFAGQIDALGTYLMNNVSGEFSMRKLTRVLGFRSGMTIEKYLRYLTEAYILFPVSRYSPKVGERLTSPKKIYGVDNGLVTSKAVRHSPDWGKLLENLVFTELVKKGFAPNRELFYYKTRNGREVDFVIKNGTSVVELVQVAYDFSNADTKQRELKALAEADEELHAEKLTVLTWNEQREAEKNGVSIHIEPFWARFQ